MERSLQLFLREVLMIIHHLPAKEYAIDALLFMGTITAIFLFGLSAIPLMPV